MLNFESTWAQDEAYGEAETIKELIQDGEDPEYVKGVVIPKLKPHWVKVFSSEADKDQLWEQFREAFNKGLSEEFHIKD